MRRSHATLLLVLALAGCASDEGPSTFDVPETRTAPAAFPTLTCAPVVTSSGERVIDPRLDGFAGATFEATVANEGTSHPGFRYALVASLRSGGTEVAALGAAELAPGGSATFRWDARRGAALADPGVYDLVVRATCVGSDTFVEHVVPVAVSRLAASAIHVDDGDGHRVPMLFHRAAGIARNYYVVPEEQAVVARSVDPTAPGGVDVDASAARPFVAPWADVASPPLDASGTLRGTDRSLPVALTLGTRPDVSLVFAATTLASTGPVAAGPVGGFAVRALVQGATAVGSDAVTPGGRAAYRMDAPPATVVGRQDLPIRITYQWLDAGTWRDVPGSETATLRVYGVLGESLVRPGGAAVAPYAAWVAVVDQVATWAAGSTGGESVTAAIVRGTYDTMSLVYDRESGASAYTSYRGFQFDGASFDLSAFLARENGNVVNCSDCASIVSTYASMMGVDSRYHIIGFDFDLNFIRAIGTADFTEFPFLSGRGGFNYHAVTSFDHAESTYDATLQIDGDGMPSSAPHAPSYAGGLTMRDYLGALTSESVRVFYDDHTDVR
ncbi:MAG: hypothetical protein IT379_35215 [Deltaproteobacteria bacterium]|nr:hypothetical protein [Deltaproteobacteria bacterium]